MTSSPHNQTASSAWMSRLRGLLRFRVWKAIVGIVILLLAFFLFGHKKEGSVESATFEAKRGPLKITVLEGGQIEARQSQEIKSEIHGQTKILKIVEEGYMVSEEDVKEGKVLVELDTSDLDERITRGEIEYQAARAANEDAKAQYEIQQKQNESDIKAAELDVKFKEMDVEKYLGKELAQEVLTKLKETSPATEIVPSVLPDVSVSVSGATPPPPPGAPAADPSPPPLSPPAAQPTPTQGTPAAPPAPQAPAAPAVSPPVTAAELGVPSPTPGSVFDFSALADDERLGGDAKQKRRKLSNDILLAENQLDADETRRGWTEKLKEQNFVTATDLTQDTMKVESSKISVESAKTSEEIFIKYEFPKQAEQSLSDFQEAQRKLLRTQKMAMSKMAQTESRLRSTEAQFTLQTERRKDLQEQKQKSVIRAKRSGLVVYGGGGDRYFGGGERVQEGANVREQQLIITIPDMTMLGANVKIHESVIRKVQKGQKAQIKLDAFPESPLTGEVSRVAPLPDSERRWMNPDLKVYTTIVNIDGVHDWIKPGFNAQVEILIKELADVLYVPVLAVTSSNGERVCYVQHGVGDPERRVVETGDANDEFMEIKSGLQEGEHVLLLSPEAVNAPDETKKPEEQGNGKAAAETQQRPNAQQPAGAPQPPNAPPPPAPAPKAEAGPSAAPPGAVPAERPPRPEGAPRGERRGKSAQ